MTPAISTSATYWQSPIGWLKLTATQGAISHIRFVDDEPSADAEPSLTPTEPQLVSQAVHAPNQAVLAQAIEQLAEYFAGSRREFDFATTNVGTPFRQQVWQALMAVPYGHTASYKDIAVAIGNPKAVRAIGSANHNNNLWLVVPCHRIIGSGGQLVGYGGGLWRKEWLLAHELKHR